MLWILKRVAGPAALLALIAFTWFGVGPVSFNYNREYNYVKKVLDRQKQLVVLDDWRHEDMTLEDFGFLIQTPETRRFKLNFYDGTRKLAPFRKAEGLSVLRPDRSTATVDFRVHPPFKVEHIRDFLERADAVLKEIEGLPSDQVPVPFTETRRFIHIIYPAESP